MEAPEKIKKLIESDQLVYELYGLTDEEIRIVEGEKYEKKKRFRI